MSRTNLSDAELHLYSRHILLDDWDLEAQQQLKDKKVLIIGAGGLGCTSAEILARTGVGSLYIIDFDTIETSNLQRQIAFKPQHVGQLKVQVLAEHLREINPHIHITSFSATFDLKFSQTWQQHDFDLVLDGCDNFATRYYVNQYCLTHQIPLLSAAAIGFEGQLMFVQQQPCYQCVFPQEEIEDTRRCSNSGVLTTTPMIMATLQAHHALLYLGLNQTPLKNKLLLWNGKTMQQRVLNVVGDINCPCCL